MQTAPKVAERLLNLIFGKMKESKTILEDFSTPYKISHWRGWGVEKSINKFILLITFLLIALPLPAQILEHIFIHTDKQIYVTGETIWMSLYCLDGESHQLSEISAVAYVELVNEAAEPVIQQKIQLTHGRGAGQLFISPELSTSTHYLRAYTQWATNSPSNHIVEIPLFVINPTDPPQLSTSQSSRNQPIHLSTTNAEISLNGAEFGRRQAISFNIEGLESAASLSVSVYKVGEENVSDQAPEPFVHNHTLATSIERAKSLPPPNWQQLSAKLNNSSSLPPELKSHSISGKLSEDFQGDLFVSFPGPDIDFYAVPTKADGRFSLELSAQISQNELMFWALGDQLSSEDLTLHSPFIKKEIFEPTAFTIPQPWQTLIASYNRNAQINHLYHTQTHIRGLQGKTRSLPFYENPKIEYYLDEFTRFPNLEEVFLEFINRAQNRKIDKKSYIHVWDEYQNIFSSSNFLVFDTAALVFLDGIPLLDPDFIWNIDVFKIQKIDIVPKRYFAGEKMFSGVIHFQTYKNDFAGKNLPNYLLSSPFIPMQRRTVFHVPDYSKSELVNKRIPDFRTTLYWNPDWEYQPGDQSISFFTGDDTGQYLIEIQGISQDGNPVYTRSTFTVSNNSQH